MKSTTDRYGAVAVSIHWLSAVLIIALLGTGFRAADATSAFDKAALLRVHVPLALALLVLTVARIVWWWRFDRRPDAVAGTPAWQAGAAHAVHLLFYVVMLGMIASGIGMMVLSGAGQAVFGTATLPDFKAYLPRVPHGIGARVLVALLVLHVAAALYHHVVRRDGLLRRMWFGR